MAEDLVKPRTIEQIKFEVFDRMDDQVNWGRVRTELSHVLNANSVDSYLAMHDYIITDLVVEMFVAMRKARKEERRLSDACDG